MAQIREVAADGAGQPILELSADERAIVANKIAALQKLLKDDEVKAKYKLEVAFGKARSIWKLTPGVVTFWENGSKFHGGGDVKIYLCPGKHLGKSDCEALIPDMANSLGKLICTSCGQMWEGTDVIGEIFLNLPMKTWAEVLYGYYRKLDYTCDIYLKHAPDDIRSIAKAQQERQTFQGSELLDRTRAKRARHIYPLRNIIKDTSAGADLLARIYAFLVA